MLKVLEQLDQFFEYEIKQIFSGISNNPYDLTSLDDRCHREEARQLYAYHMFSAIIKDSISKLENSSDEEKKIIRSDVQEHIGENLDVMEYYFHIGLPKEIRVMLNNEGMI